MAQLGRHRIIAASSTIRGARRWLIVLLAGVLLVPSVAVVAGTAAGADEIPLVRGAAIASDSLDRVVSTGWGDAPLGGTWSTPHSASFAVNGAAAVSAPPRSGSSVTASLGSVSAADVSVSTELSVPVIPAAGNGIYSGIQLRQSAAAHYLASTRIAPGGSVYLSVLRVVGGTAQQVRLVSDTLVVTGLEANETLHVEAGVSGTAPVELTVRAWTGDGDAPDWQVSVDDTADTRIVDAGALALWTYVSSGSRPVPVAYSNFEAFALEPGVAPPAEPGPITPGPTPTEPTPTEPAPEPAPVTELTGARGTPGAAPVGSTEYPVPAAAIVVSPSGSDAAKGTLDAPLATLTRAVAVAPSGSTIVLRAGSYHGTVIVPTGKRLTIQSYPLEEVWLDGSRVVDDFTRDSQSWVADGWNIRFDHSPTYRRGAADGTAAGWQFVNPQYPMAAHPDQVWIGGVAQRQVGSLAEVTAGTFWVDEGNEQLHLGSDPTAAEVRASDTVKALVIAGAGTVVRGIGIQRFAPSVPDIGAVAIAASNVSLENVTITDSATTGLAIFSSNARLRDVTILRSGMLGAQASQSDGLVATGLLIADNNTERFNRAPVSGGFKIHKSRDVRVSDSAFLRNRGNGLWFDESVYDMTITGNDVIDSVGNGIVIELSALAVVANNVVAGSERDGVLVSDSGNVSIWNNTITGNFRSINIVQGDRRASNLSLPGHDNRQQLPDPTVTWITENVSVGNNVLADGTGKCVLCVEDYSHERSAADMGIVSDGNVFQRSSASQPSWLVVWSRGPGNPEVFTTLEAFRAASKNDAHSFAVDGRAVLVDGALAPFVASLENSIARPLPSRVATVTGKQPGLKHLGAW